MVTPEPQHRVAIADPEPRWQRWLVDVLGHADHLVPIGTAGDVDGLLEMAGRLQADVVVVDLGLPGGDPRVPSELLDLGVGRVVVHTTSIDPHAVIETLRSGASGWIVKSGDAVELIATIDSSIAGERRLGKSIDVAVRDAFLHWITVRPPHPERDHIVEQVRRLANREGVDVVYQPIIDLTDDAVIGYEAFARFDVDPPLPPHHWIEAAHLLGLGTPVELAALRTALDGAAELSRGQFVLVNVSGRTAVEAGLLEVVSGGAAHHVVLDLTDEPQASSFEEVVGSLRTLGVGICVPQSWPLATQIGPDLVRIELLDEPLRPWVGGRRIAQRVETEAQLRTARQGFAELVQGGAPARPLTRDELGRR